MHKQTQTIPFKIISYGFLRSYFITMRPYLLFVSGITGAVGLSFVSNIDHYSAALIFIMTFLSYGFGQALTDCFQIDTDSISSPYRPLTQKIIKRRDVFLISLIGLILIGGGLTAFAPVNLLLALVAIFGLITYTFFKKRWWSGPLYNAWIVMLLCVMAFFAGEGGLNNQQGWSPQFYFTLMATLFTYANFVLTGYFKDISADQKTGYKTLPVVYGKRVSAKVSDVLAIISILSTICAVYFILKQDYNIISQIGGMFFLAFGFVLLAHAQLRLHKVDKEEEAYYAISFVVHAYILLLSSIIIANKVEWLPVIVLFYIAFNITMKLRPMKQQI